MELGYCETGNCEHNSLFHSDSILNNISLNIYLNISLYNTVVWDNHKVVLGIKTSLFSDTNNTPKTLLFHVPCALRGVWSYQSEVIETRYCKYFLWISSTETEHHNIISSYRHCYRAVIVPVCRNLNLCECRATNQTKLLINGFQTLNFV